MPTAEPEQFVEVYRTDSTIAAHKILDVILVPEGIQAQVHDRLEGMFHGQGLPGGVYIAVLKDQADQARGLIGEALDNGFLEQDEGEVV